MQSDGQGESPSGNAAARSQARCKIKNERGNQNENLCY